MFAYRFRLYRFKTYYWTLWMGKRLPNAPVANTDVQNFHAKFRVVANAVVEPFHVGTDTLRPLLGECNSSLQLHRRHRNHPK